VLNRKLLSTAQRIPLLFALSPPPHPGWHKEHRWFLPSSRGRCGLAELISSCAGGLGAWFSEKVCLQGVDDRKDREGENKQNLILTHTHNACLFHVCNKTQLITRIPTYT